VGRPRFDRPDFTQPPAEVVPAAALAAEADPLPELVDPDLPPVTEPVDEPLVEVSHRAVRVLTNYWHGGWRNATALCLLRESVAERLYRVAGALERPWGLAVFDAWRPDALQHELYDAATAMHAIPGFMAPPDIHPTRPAPHPSGGAVDLTLTWKGTALSAGTGFDDPTERAAVAALEDEPGPERELRRRLYWAMRAEGFVVYVGEWWHFEHGTRRWAAISGGTPVYGPAAPAVA
jgi:zinc D-Ala-D-Ala dipeptidase